MDISHTINFTRSILASAPARSMEDRAIPTDEAFHRVISVERKRTARSRQPFLLMLLDIHNCLSHHNSSTLDSIISVLTSSTRETDITGWYKDNSVIGIMFTEIGRTAHEPIISNILGRLSSALRTRLAPGQFDQIAISFHLFPEERSQVPPQPPNRVLYPDLVRRDNSRLSFRVIKRLMDVVGSVLALALCGPIFVVITAIIKLTSKGPVLFRQSRLGQYGAPFVFFKFRSMYSDNDPNIHINYVRKLIAGEPDLPSPLTGDTAAYKLTKDPRITRFGALLRKTSLDELPQFINVLKGEMSLVGPRPPIPYEVEAYDIWHRRRLLEAKPGITGLWQVYGRSKVKFDDMVRLDLRYAQMWTPWLDVKILARTPRAVLLGGGAY